MRRQVVRWIVAVAAVIAPATPGPRGIVAGQEAGVLRVPLGGEPPTLDPYFAVDSASSALVMMMYDTLVRVDGTGGLCPPVSKPPDVGPPRVGSAAHPPPLSLP